MVRCSNCRRDTLDTGEGTKWCPRCGARNLVSLKKGRGTNWGKNHRKKRQNMSKRAQRARASQRKGR